MALIVLALGFAFVQVVVALLLIAVLALVLLLIPMPIVMRSMIWYRDEQQRDDNDGMVVGRTGVVGIAVVGNVLMVVVEVVGG